MTIERKTRKEQLGNVVSDKMDKSIVVVTKAHVKHPRYGKYYVKRTKFAVHDENNVAKMGDLVRIRETRPMSKTKNWRVVEVIKRSELAGEEASV